MADDVAQSGGIMKYLKTGTIIAGSITAFFGAHAALGKAGVPTFVFTNTLDGTTTPIVASIKKLYILQAQAEVDARSRVDRSDQILLFDLKQQIEEKRRANVPITTETIEQLQRREEEANDNRAKREQAIKRIEQNQ